jgi:lipopolysaccharide/colanic/teichoic acid biosynthesis glycosyltransferase
MLGLEIRQNLLLLRNRVIKKTMDLVLVGPCFLAAAPVIAVFAVAVKLVDRGPAFYAQEREGLRGRRIRVWKLRTMIVDSQTALDRHLAANPAAREEWDRFCKLKDDPRILPVIGRFMRSTSIDELPQLWNVVRGDLSLVGPRPFPVYHLEKFPEDFRKLRASVMPGVTGLWQVSERSDADIERQELLDTYYIRNWSPWMDLQLLFRTVWALAFRRGGAR